MIAAGAQATSAAKTKYTPATPLTIAVSTFFRAFVRCRSCGSTTPRKPRRRIPWAAPK